jgi:TM2 domain-containing membrane protein YozV
MANEKFCPICGSALHPMAEICPKCGVRQPGMEAPGMPSVPRPDEGKRIAAGICGILIGALGIHKYILGLNTAGTIMLLVSLLTCGIGAIPMHVIGLIEGIIYLSKSDEEFYQTYIVGRKEWF